MLTRLLVVMIAGGLLPLGARLWWPLELSSHFRLQYLALAALVLAAALVARKLEPAAALAAVMALNVWPLLPYLPHGSEPGHGTPLSVLNLNANAGNAEHDRLLTAIGRSGADIVSLTELSPALAARLAELAESYPYRLAHPTADNFGIAVLSRHPLGPAEAFELVASTAISARIDVAGRDLRFLAVHLLPPMTGARAADRNRQLDALAVLASESDEPLVICGDFNLSPYSPYFARFESEAGLHAAQRGHGLTISWPTQMPLLGVPIDHCFLRGGLASESVETMDQTGSDHYPVLVRLRWHEPQ